MVFSRNLLYVWEVEEVCRTDIFYKKLIWNIEKIIPVGKYWSLFMKIFLSFDIIKIYCSLYYFTVTETQRNEEEEEEEEKYVSFFILIILLNKVWKYKKYKRTSLEN